jgi:hypothetical protein
MLKRIFIGAVIVAASTFIVRYANKKLSYDDLNWEDIFKNM